MYGNELPADQIAALKPGDKVFYTRGGPAIRTGLVSRITPTTIVVRHLGEFGLIETRFRRDNAQRISGKWMLRGALLDPTHPQTIEALEGGQ